MKNYCIRFSEDLERATNQHIDLAYRIWKDAAPDTSAPLRVAAGNFAGYGNYVARCHDSGVIEFPIGNKKSALQHEGTEITIKGSSQRYLATLLHEMGHHVVNTATATPWKDIRHGGQSTHLRNEWLWICYTAWSYFHGQVMTPRAMVDVLKSTNSKHRKAMVKSLEYFSYFCPPPVFEDDTPVPKCQRCNSPMKYKRRGTKYCSTNCRVMASRQNKVKQEV